MAKFLSGIGSVFQCPADGHKTILETVESCQVKGCLRNVGDCDVLPLYIVFGGQPACEFPAGTSRVFSAACYVVFDRRILIDECPHAPQKRR